MQTHQWPVIFTHKKTQRRLWKHIYNWNMKYKMFYKEKPLGRLRQGWGVRATADSLLGVMSLCSAVPAREAGSGSVAHVGHPDGAARVVLQRGKDFIPTRLILKSDENVCDQMRPVGFVVIIKLNVIRHIHNLWRPWDFFVSEGEVGILFFLRCPSVKQNQSLLVLQH